ncbi:MAG: hypothetical protein A3F14_01550 [Gammaproteobacteria bacterium RIFCSPHIGHO2_12_FULL_43_28]|nr:MAG: hypothetical protein A3F14_01550 [Gammaproteobacteria bacterium RIFCSPHIGHO2_12_FULL_43_28]
MKKNLFFQRFPLTLTRWGIPKGGERSEGEAKRAILPLGCKQKLVFCAASKQGSLPAFFSGKAVIFL